ASHQYLHPFPTRRSSDLADVIITRALSIISSRSGVARFIHLCSFLPLSRLLSLGVCSAVGSGRPGLSIFMTLCPASARRPPQYRSEEHTSELQSRENLVC